MDDIKQYLECNNKLREHIKDFIEIFVEYYGEENRKFIEKRFNDAMYIGYLPENVYNSILNSLEKQERDILYDKFVNTISFDISKEQLFEDSPIESISYSPVGKFKLFYDEYSLGKEGRYKKYYNQGYSLLCNFVGENKVTYDEYVEMVRTQTLHPIFDKYSDKVKSYIYSYIDISSYEKTYENDKKKAVEFLKAIDESITIDNIEDKIPSIVGLNDLFEQLEQLKVEYNNFKKQFQKYYDIRDYNSELSDNLKNKYYDEYLNEVVNLLSGKTKENVLEYLNNKENSLNYDTKDIVGHSLSSSGLIDYFSSSSEEKLNSQEVFGWEKDTIKTNRIEYFNSIGIDLEQDYEAYKDLEAIFPETRNVDEIIRLREKYLSKYKRDYYNNMLPQKLLNDEANERGFLDFDNNEAAVIRSGKFTCVCANVVKDDDFYSLAAKVFIKFDVNDSTARDHFIVHELNHLYELALLGVSGSKCSYISGWDSFEEDMDREISNIDIHQKRRKYELFNEIVNEKIAQDISKMMVDRGIEIFGSATEKSYTNTTSYDATNYLVDDFFNIFKDKIFESRRDNNIQVIYDAVGKDNFDDLNVLFEIHNKYFSGFKYYNLFDDLNNKKETEATKIFYDLLDKRDEILNNMQEHYKKYNGTHTR